MRDERMKMRTLRVHHDGVPRSRVLSRSERRLTRTKVETISCARLVAGGVSAKNDRQPWSAQWPARISRQFRDGSARREATFLKKDAGAELCSSDGNADAARSSRQSVMTTETARRASVKRPSERFAHVRRRRALIFLENRWSGFRTVFRL
jgi:hypothetical protein